MPEVHIMAFLFSSQLSGPTPLHSNFEDVETPYRSGIVLIEETRGEKYPEYTIQMNDLAIVLEGHVNENMRLCIAYIILRQILFWFDGLILPSIERLTMSWTRLQCCLVFY